MADRTERNNSPTLHNRVNKYTYISKRTKFAIEYQHNVSSCSWEVVIRITDN